MIDLHSHSRASDGTHNPNELLNLAQKAGLKTFAITDHDTMAGYLSLLPKANNEGCFWHGDMQVVAGVEISCRHRLTGGYGKNAATDKIIHIVGLAIKDVQAMQEALCQLQDERAHRGRLMADKLAQLFVDDSDTLWQTILHKAAGNPKAVGRAHIAQALYELGKVKSLQDAFDKYLADGKAAYVPLQAWDMATAIAMIHQCGGVAVLAHPTRYHLSATRVRRLIGDFAAVGGDGVELPTDGEPISARYMIDRAVATYDLLVSVGSDFHGDSMPWRKLGVVPKPTQNQTGIWTKFKQTSTG